MVFVWTVYLFSLFMFVCECQPDFGPDPWNMVSNERSFNLKDDRDIPPDLRLPPVKQTVTKKTFGSGEWFFKRLLTILLKDGQIKKNEDSTVDVTIQMKFDEKQWQMFEEYLIPSTTFTDDMYRRTLGNIEESIYKPNVLVLVVESWNDSICQFLTENKSYITWGLVVAGIVVGVFYFWNYVTFRHKMLVLFISLYLYEAITSYKEVEKMEIDKFVTAVNKCNWKIWSSVCEVPAPDPLVFLKHMNPLRIALRMFTIFISEPMIILSNTVKTMIEGITDGLVFPFNIIVYSFLIVMFNIILIMILIMALFNYIFNIPFSFNMGLLNLRILQINREKVSFKSNEHSVPKSEGGDKISEHTFNKFLDVLSHSLSINKITIEKPTKAITNESNSKTKQGLQRSASTGRLAQLRTFESGEKQAEVNLRKRRADGSGDAN